MTIEVVDTDGTIIEFPDGTPQTDIQRVMRRRDQERDARVRAGEGGVGARLGAIIGRPGTVALPSGEAEGFRRRALRDRRAPEGTVLRGLQDFNRNGPAGLMNQMMRNVGIADDVAYWGERLRGGSRENAQGAERYERDRQRQVAVEQPRLNAASIGASIPALGGIGVPGRVGLASAGAAAAGVNAPFALARQEGNLEERLPGAAVETAIVGGLGAGIQGLANALSRPPVTASAAGRVAEFDAAGVRPMLAAVQGRGNAPMAMAIAENPVGGNVRRNLQNSADDVANAARGLTARAGTPEPREIAGETIQGAVRRFAQDRGAPAPAGVPPRSVPVRDWSFSGKANALYDDVFGRLALDERQMVGAVEGPILDLTATMRVMDDIENAVQGPASRAFMESADLTQMRRALQSDDAIGELRFQDLRRWRTWVREAQRNEGLRQTIGQANLQRLEQALTTDIYASAMNIGGVAAHDLRQIDRWYRAGQQRIQRALQQFDSANGGAQAFRRAIDLASQGGRQNTAALRQLRASLRPDEWRQVSASILDELGNPRFGAPTVMEPSAFSLENFVQNVARLSPEGRQALFGSLADDLERLARVAGSLKQVRGFTNYSRSGSSMQNMGTFGAAGASLASAFSGNMVPLGALIMTGMAARITGEMLTNPAFVRWLTRGAGAGRGMRHQIAALGPIAARDPALAPLYAELARLAGDQPQTGADRSGAPTDPQLGRRELVQ